MMTSQSTTGTLALTRSVREVVADQPELVTEVWCRKIFRHILQLLERDYALRRPHAPITPDTVGFDEHGEPALMTADGNSFQPSEAVDVQSLGGVIHYAITLEEVPTMSLRKRGQEGYSESLLTAVDKCLSANPADRPQTIADLRNLLGIVALGPTIGAATAAPPVYVQPTAAPARGMAGVGKWQRWLMIGLAAIVLLAAGSALWMLLRGTTNNDSVVLTLPDTLPSKAPAGRVDAAPPAPAPSQPVQVADAGHTPPVPETASTGTHQMPPAEPVAPAQPAVAPPAPPAPATQRARKPVPTAPPRTAANSAGASAATVDDDDITTYKLMIKPWGTVYVDGSERGVSPPLKLLSLPAGRHTVRVVNPNFRDRVVRVSAGKHDAGRIEVNFKD
jgi:hypothetical protein